MTASIGTTSENTIKDNERPNNEIKRETNTTAMKNTKQQ